MGGTRCFLAPELRERPSTFEPTVDVFGLGALLHVMLTGAAPGTEPIHALANDNDSRVSRQALEIAQLCLGLNPKDRPQTAAQVVALLAAIARK